MVRRKTVKVHCEERITELENRITKLTGRQPSLFERIFLRKVDRQIQQRIELNEEKIIRIRNFCMYKDHSWEKKQDGKEHCSDCQVLRRVDWIGYERKKKK